ncbi:hypothetical protein DPMN_186759 [Dreissena polymorpha]|uniref:Uncharacterized protein n=1 Tax=Dreissena polymorpha TaxID=45954 RepID=A0A9D4DM24_DREPO|nr:hypothetical protein DPMN_186759 [Dreissena polymorpha]
MPGRCRFSPGHYRRHQGLSRGITGINHSAGLLTGFNGAAPGNSFTVLKFLRVNPVLAGVSKPGWTGALPAKVMKNKFPVRVLRTLEVMEGSSFESKNEIEDIKRTSKDERSEIDALKKKRSKTQNAVTISVLTILTDEGIASEFLA